MNKKRYYKKNNVEIIDNTTTAAGLFAITDNLAFDTPLIYYKCGDTAVKLNRPSVISSRYKNYDVNVNFQIIIDVNRVTRDVTTYMLKDIKSTHLRCFQNVVALATRYQGARELLIDMVDNITLGMNPLDSIKPLKKKFPDIELIEHEPVEFLPILIQLFIHEQDICYPTHKKSRYYRSSSWFTGNLKALLYANLAERDVFDVMAGIVHSRIPDKCYTIDIENEYKRVYGENFGETIDSIKLLSEINLAPGWGKETILLNKIARQNRKVDYINKRSLAFDIKNRLMSQITIMGDTDEDNNLLKPLERKDVAKIIREYTKENISAGMLLSKVAITEAGQYRMFIKLHSEVMTSIVLNIIPRTASAVA